MAEKSIYSRGSSGMTTGGLDRYLGPQAIDHSSLPDPPESSLPDDLSEMNCEGQNADQAVCQIAKAERERQAERAKLKAGDD